MTADLPEELVSRLDEVAQRIERSKSWIVRQALTEWLADEHLRYELTLEAMKSVDEGRTIPHEKVMAMMAEQRKAAAASSARLRSIIFPAVGSDEARLFERRCPISQQNIRWPLGGKA